MIGQITIFANYLEKNPQDVLITTESLRVVATYEINKV